MKQSQPESKLGAPIAIVMLKLGVTGVCLWYIARQIAFENLAQVAGTIDRRWIVAAVVALMAQVPLVALRWVFIVDAMAAPDERKVARLPMMMTTAIGLFAGQVLHSVTGDALRLWLLTRLGRPWSVSATSVLIDRGVGAITLFSLSFCILLLPSPLTELGGFRSVALLLLGMTVMIAVVSLAMARAAAPLLNRLKWTHWLGNVALATHQVLFRSPLRLRILLLGLSIHLLAIAAIWALSHALALGLSAVDSATLFVVMLGVSLAPISLNGWGVRELTVTAFLANHGISSEAALLLSVCFGLVMIAATLPGALGWLAYRPRSRDS